MKERPRVPQTSPLNYLQTVIPVILFAVAVSSCEDPGQPLDYINGTYEYTGYDLNGNVVAFGTLTLFRDNRDVRGQKVLSGAFPDSGSGEVSGEIIELRVLRLFLFVGEPYTGSMYIEGNINNGIIQGDRFTRPDRGFDQKIGTFRATRRTSHE